MSLVLKVENETSLPNGAPTVMRVAEGRSLDIGRGAHLDWTLPDPSRFISGKHCEIRSRDGGFWLYDVSTNGTFLNESARRLQAPHRLVDGDRLTIGSYVIAVALEVEGSPAQAEAEDHAVAWPETAPYLAEAFAPTPPQPEPVEPAFQSMPEEVAAPALSLAEQFAARALSPVEPPPLAAWDEMPEEPVAPMPEPEPEPELHMPPPVALPDAPMPPPIVAFEAPMPPPLVEPEPVAPPPVPEPAPVARFEPTPLPEVAASQAPAFVEPTPAPARPLAAEAPAGVREPATVDEFIARFAKGAGIPENIFARQDALKVAEDMGALMRIIAENITQLLAARFKAKRFARTSNQTMIQALDNNPLKFAPTPEDALRIMFGPRTSGYLDARRALDAAFKDLKTHQVKTFSAMQGAVNMLVEDLDPAEIDTALGDSKSMLDVLGGRKARLWDLYLARWQAKTLRHEDGLTDAFMLYFAECYDRSEDKA